MLSGRCNRVLLQLAGLHVACCFLYCSCDRGFKQYYVRQQELVYLAHDDIVDCGKGVRTLEILK